MGIEATDTCVVSFCPTPSPSQTIGGQFKDYEKLKGVFLASVFTDPVTEDETAGMTLLCTVLQNLLAQTYFASQVYILQQRLSLTEELRALSTAVMEETYHSPKDVVDALTSALQKGGHCFPSGTTLTLSVVDEEGAVMEDFPSIPWPETVSKAMSAGTPILGAAKADDQLAKWWEEDISVLEKINVKQEVVTVTMALPFRHIGKLQRHCVVQLLLPQTAFYKTPLFQQLPKAPFSEWFASWSRQLRDLYQLCDASHHEKVHSSALAFARHLTQAAEHGEVMSKVARFFKVQLKMGWVEVYLYDEQEGALIPASGNAKEAIMVEGERIGWSGEHLDVGEEGASGGAYPLQFIVQSFRQQALCLINDNTNSIGRIAVPLTDRNSGQQLGVIGAVGPCVYPSISGTFKEALKHLGQASAACLMRIHQNTASITKALQAKDQEIEGLEEAVASLRRALAMQVR